ncbi:CCA tRNA nucleotidyltransferase [Geminicoccus roseus]|uniref:CCA tRNA nucleotidyltransferase n=1 Tax=Geminicoccus roseus TaxID=404900 RepID=UPI0003FA5952|nr:CCA tRNA nucleotidyltransferase [Geminicoccus roseus]
MNKPPRLAAPWLTLAPTRRVMAALEEAGGRAWFVGGCVRDSLLAGDAVDPGLDIDIATDLVPDRVMALAGAAGLKAVPTGIEHGTVTLIVNGRPFEVTTLRRDLETDGRRALVAFGTSLEEDAARRDFTINALYAQADGLVVDPLGGLADLARRRVRFVGDPDRRIVEDYLRVLRFFRFHARFGGSSPDPEGFQACVRHRDRLGSLSAERVARELLKLLVAPNALASLRAMRDGGILAALDLRGAVPEGLEALLRAWPASDALVRLAALFRQEEPAPGQGIALAGRLRLSTAERDRLEAMLGLPLPALEEDPAERARGWYRGGSATPWRDRFLLAAALHGLTPDQVQPLVDGAAAWVRPRFPLSGADVLALGAPPGRAVGVLLRQVEAWWLARDMLPDRQACLDELRSRYRVDELLQPP